MSGVAIESRPGTRADRAVAPRAGLDGRLAGLFRPVDAASLAWFRIAFGTLMAWEAWRYLAHDTVLRNYVEPAFHFPYFGLDFVRPWPGWGMYAHFYVVGLLAVCVALGLFYRLTTVLLWVALTYVFLLDQAKYLNHFYLICLFSLLLIFAPAHRSMSLDARRRPALRSDVVPAWSLWMLRAQMGLVYFYAGVAKIQGDWLRGYPLHEWLGRQTSVPLIGPLFHWPPMIVAFSWGAMLFDLLVAPALVWRRTRVPAFALALTFHLLNAQMFDIGVFPWLAIGATTLFLEPAWPRRVFHWPSVRKFAAWSPPGRTARRVTVLLLGAYFVVQLALPLRHWLFPGNVNWTEEGHRFSWHMKLRDKDATARFVLTDPASGRRWVVNPEQHLTPRQAEKLAARPYMIQAYARHLAEQARRQGHERVEVRAHVEAALNGRKRQPLIDPDVDLAAEPHRWFRADPWILPLTEPLQPPRRSLPRALPDDDP